MKPYLDEYPNSPNCLELIKRSCQEGRDTHNQRRKCAAWYPNGKLRKEHIQQSIVKILTGLSLLGRISEKQYGFPRPANCEQAFA